MNERTRPLLPYDGAKLHTSALPAKASRSEARSVKPQSALVGGSCLAGIWDSATSTPSNNGGHSFRLDLLFIAALSLQLCNLTDQRGLPNMDSAVLGAAHAGGKPEQVQDVMDVEGKVDVERLSQAPYQDLQTHIHPFESTRAYKIARWKSTVFPILVSSKNLTLNTRPLLFQSTSL